MERLGIYLFFDESNRESEHAVAPFSKGRHVEAWDAQAVSIAPADSISKGGHFGVHLNMQSFETRVILVRWFYHGEDDANARRPALPQLRPDRGSIMAFRQKTAILAFTASIFICVYQPFASAQKRPTPKELQNIATNAARHFGDAPDNPGPLATDLSYSIKPRAVAKAMRKVADWQLEQSQPYFDRIWTWSVLYSGFMAASDSLPWGECSTGSCGRTCPMPTIRAWRRPIWSFIC
jgi:hypothetical protein